MEGAAQQAKHASVATQTSDPYTAKTTLHTATDVESSTFADLNIAPFTPKILEVSARTRQQPPVNPILARLIAHPLPKHIHPRSVDHIDQILRALNRKTINLLVLRSLAFKGVPTEIPGLRAVVWQILLHYLPLQTAEWERTLQESKELYLSYQKELIIKPDIAKLQVPQTKDHPLSVSDSSEWNLFFKDQDLMECVEKDVKRTRTEMEFFVGAIDATQNNNKQQLYRQSELRLGELTMKDKQNYIETHADVLLRMLFVFGKLNKGIGYVQGMNEIIAVLYYCFFQAQGQQIESISSSDNNRLVQIKEDYLHQIEADTFFTFTHLFGEIRDRFVRSLDNTQDGLNGSIARVANLLHELDPEISGHIKGLEVLPHYYLLKWTMLLVCQQLNMPDVCELWDCLFADPTRFEFLDYICVAMVRSVRDKALATDDFIDLMPILQDIKVEDIRVLIAQAVQLSRSSPAYRDFVQEPHRMDGVVPGKQQQPSSWFMKTLASVKKNLKKLKKK